MSRPYILILLLNATFVISLYSQKNEKFIDSLRTELARAKDDTNKVNLLNSLSKEAGWMAGKTDTALAFANKAKALAEKLRFKQGLADAYNGIANSYGKGNSAEAIKNHFTSLLISKELDDKPREANAYYSIGNAYWGQGDLSEALKNHLASLNIKEEIRDKKGISWSYNSLGLLYWYLHDLPKALESYAASIKIKEELGDKKGVANSYINMGNLYTSDGRHADAIEIYEKVLQISKDLGDKRQISVAYGNIGSAYSNMRKYNEALENHLKALKINEELGDKRAISSNYTAIGTDYFKLKNYPESLKSYSYVLKIAEETDDKYYVGISHSNIGKLYLAENKFIEAKLSFEKGLALAKTTGEKIEIRNSYKDLAETDSLLGNYLEAYKSYKKYVVYKDSILGQENTKKIAKLEMQYDFGKKEAAVKLGFEKSQDSLRIEQQKELELRQLSYEFEQKQALAKTEEERRQLIYEEKLKRQSIETEYSKQQAKRQAEQEKKDALAAEELRRKKLQRNASIIGLGLTLLLAGVFLIQRNRINKEKKRSDDLLLNILPSEVAEELKEKGSAEAKLIDNVTVLFTDFKGFTAMSEQLSPKELVKDLNECFSVFDKIMEKYGMEKIKTIGDSYMAAGGLPTPNLTHAHDAVKAAIEMRDFIADGKAIKKQNGLPYFEIRIGIHTGPVVAGIVGVKKFQYDIWGDTVNTASRMESSGEVGRINVSETTFQMVSDNYICEYRGELEAKGKGAMKMYFVDSLRK